MVPRTERTPHVRLHLTVLGAFRATRNAEAFAQLHQGRLRALITFLLLHHKAPVSRQRVAFALWPDTSDKQARTNLRTLLARLRQALGEFEYLLQATRQTLHLRPDGALTADVTEFEQALDLAELASTRADRAQWLESAVAVYSGDLLPDCHDEWAIQAREELRTGYLNALEQLAHIHENARRYERAIQYARLFLRADPLDEAGYRRLMRLYALSGERGRALRTYERCVEIMRLELDVEPGAKTQQTYQTLLQHPQARQPYPQTHAGQAPLVGRELEWMQLVEVWRLANAGRPGLLLITGEAGIGKTRLAEELADWAARQGIDTASAQSYALGRDMAFAPVIQWLRSAALYPHWQTLDDVWLSELARLMPELLAARSDLPSPDAVNERWQHHHQSEAMARAVLAGGRPLLLIIDDLQWSGREMLDWLYHLLHSAAEFPLLILATVRTDEVSDDPAYAAFCLALQRSDLLSEVRLQALSAAETEQLAEALQGKPLGDSASVALYRESEGNPLFVVEMIRAHESGAAGFVPHEDTDRPASSPQASRPLPAKVAAVLQYRLAQLSVPTHGILQCAAVIGRQFTFDTLVEMCEQPEESVVAALDELWQRHIIRGQGTNAFDFSHDKLRAVTYAQLSPARRRWYHRRVAEVLNRQNADDPDAVSAQIATHYELAGLAHAAIDGYERAAQAAMRLHANDDAVFYLRCGLALLEVERGATPQAQTLQTQAMRLLDRLGDIYAVTGRHEEARAAYRAILTKSPLLSPLRQGTLLRKIGDCFYTQHRHDLALATYRTAEARLEGDSTNSDPAWRQAWLQLQLSLMGLHYGMAANDKLSQLVRKLRPIVMEHGTLVQWAEFLENVALDGMRRDRYQVSDATLADQQAALVAWRATNDQGGIANNQFSLGFCRLWRRELDAADTELQGALQRATAVGHARVRLLCITYVAVLERFRGDLEQTQLHAKQALELADEIGIQFYIGMAKANLAWAAARRRQTDAAEQLCREALGLMPAAYPFRWAAVWPLLGLSLQRKDGSTAIHCVQQLLDPDQQRMPPDLTRLLVTGFAAAELPANMVAEPLHQAAALAAKLGYL